MGSLSGRGWISSAVSWDWEVIRWSGEEVERWVNSIVELSGIWDIDLHAGTMKDLFCGICLID